jgi:hypothetical protein
LAANRAVLKPTATSMVRARDRCVIKLAAARMRGLSVFVFAIGGASLGCAEAATRTTTPVEPAAIASLSVSPDTLTLQRGSQFQIVAEARDRSGAVVQGATISWSSENASVATVTTTGLVTAIGVGSKVNIVASAQSQRASAAITVPFPAKDSVMVRAGVEAIVRAGNEAEIRIPADRLAPGSVAIAEAMAGRIGTAGTPIGSAVRVTVRTPSVGSVRSAPAQADAIVPFSISLAGQTAMSGVEAPYRLAAFAQGLPGMSLGLTIPVLPSSVVATPNKLGSFTATFPIGLTAGSTPAIINIQLTALDAGCSQSELPDSERLQQIREAKAVAAGAKPIVVLLVHGWQFLQLSCADAARYTFRDEATWKQFIENLFPAAAFGGSALRFLQYDLFSYKYLSTSTFSEIGEDLSRLVGIKFAGRRVVILAHSKGGLVSAAAMLASDPSRVLELITVGTPWNGTPIGGTGGDAGSVLQFGCYLFYPLSALYELLGTQECSLFSNWRLGARDLGVGESGNIATQITPRRSELTGRVVALGSDITAGTYYPSGAGLAAFYILGAAAIKRAADGSSTTQPSSDGLVPTSSSRPSADFAKLLPPQLPLIGFDHSGYLTVTPGGVSPTGQSLVVDELTRILDQYIPVAAVTVAPSRITLVPGETAILTANALDAVGASLLGRTITWASSAPNEASVSASGIVTAHAPSNVSATITATCEGRSGAVEVTVLQSASDDWRAVLTWGGAPNDLDSYLTGPTPTGARFAIYYANAGDCAQLPYACLEEDISNAGGPETIRITQSFPGKYVYSVHNFSGGNSASSTTLSQSNARVALYRGGALVQTFPVPQQPGTLWTVFEIEGGAVRAVGAMSGLSPPRQGIAALESATRRGAIPP